MHDKADWDICVLSATSPLKSLSVKKKLYWSVVAHPREPHVACLPSPKPVVTSGPTPNYQSYQTVKMGFPHKEVSVIWLLVWLLELALKYDMTTNFRKYLILSFLCLYGVFELEKGAICLRWIPPSLFLSVFVDRFSGSALFICVQVLCFPILTFVKLCPPIFTPNNGYLVVSVLTLHYHYMALAV